jgi:glycosyltransferase involved in cell wall biosynthesis
MPASDDMLVSVIMPALNADRFIEAALRSLLREREAVKLDIIVIDDGSNDDTRAIVESMARDFPELRLLQNPRKGIPAARNTGLEHIRPDCRFVTFHDADDLSYPGRIERQRSLLLNDPSIDALYGLMQMFRVLDKQTQAPAAGHPTKIIRGPYLQSSMYRPSVFDKVGRFDESFRQGDDTDFVLRVIDHDYKIMLDDGIATYYRRHDANVTLDVAQVQREFMLASVKFAMRRRKSGKGPIPPIFSELFLSRDQIEKGFET